MSSSFATHQRNYDFGARLRAAMHPRPAQPPPPPCQQEVVEEAAAAQNNTELGIFDRFRFRETKEEEVRRHIIIKPTAPAPCPSPPQQHQARPPLPSPPVKHHHSISRWYPAAPLERRRHCRSVSGYRKRYVAASQSWMCAGRCGQLLPASFEVDHIVRLDRGGDNNVTNLVALCRNCHGHKTFVEML
jgi:hypothetical protein